MVGCELTAKFLNLIYSSNVVMDETRLKYYVMNSSIISGTANYLKPNNPLELREIVAQGIRIVSH